MTKRAVGVLLASIAFCATAAAFTIHNIPKSEHMGSAETEQEMLLQPETEGIIPIGEHSIGIKDQPLSDTLKASADYGTIFPYAAQIVGWTAENKPVMRYAMADSGGVQITNAVFTSVERVACGEEFVWILCREQEDAVWTTCAASDGSWTLGPYQGTITVLNDKIFVRRTANAVVSTVYNCDGKIIGQIFGKPKSFTDGKIVSYSEEAGGVLWHLYDADTLHEINRRTVLSVGSFSEGFAAVQLTEGQYGIMDDTGEVLEIPGLILYDSLEGCFLAKNTQGMYGVIDGNGEELIPFLYTRAAECSKEVALYQLWESEEECIVLHAPDGQKLSLPNDLNAQQLEFLPQHYFSYVNEEKDQRIIFDDLVSIKTEGNTQLFPQGEQTVIAASENSYRVISLDDGDIGKKKEYRYVPPQTDAERQNTVFTIEDTETGLQGIGNIKGKIVLKPIYDSIYSVDGSYYAAVKGCWSGIVDANGDWIIRTQLTGMD